ncbi:hypothetical protein D3C77_746540 [compost metagenome]
MGHLVGPGIHLGVAQGLPGINQKRSLTMFTDLIFQAVSQGIEVARLDLRTGGGAAVEQRLGLLTGHRRSDRQVHALHRRHGVTSRVSAW